jgi:hypothetical protein
MIWLLLACTGENGGGDDTGLVDGSDPLFALMTQVYSADDRTVYIALTESLDLGDDVLDQSHEFGGVANFAPIGGRILVSDGQEPTITEYAISDDLEWQAGDAVSFLDYPLEDNANWYYQFVVDQNTVYLPLRINQRIVWDPAAMVITGVMKESAVPLEQDGLTVYSSGNRNAVRYDGPSLQSFFAVSKDWETYGQASWIAAYDPVTSEETTVIDAPCTAMAIGTQAEDGSTYFGTWDYLGIDALYGRGPAPCMVRVLPDLTIDDTFTTDFTSWTDGRYVNNFRYVGNGKAIGNVLHHENLGYDFSAPYDSTIWDVVWTSGPHWKFWIFDLDAEAAHPVEGIDVDISSGAQFAVLEGRTFVFLPYDDWGRTKIYELDDAGVATEHADVLGDVFKWEHVR